MRNRVLVIVAIVGFLGWRYGCQEKREAAVVETQTIEHQLAPIYKEKKASLKKIRATTDSVIAANPVSISTPVVKTIVKAERDGADSVIATGDARIANLQKQITLLSPARLKLYGEADYSSLNGPGVRLGASLRLDPSLSAYGYHETSTNGEASWHVGVRKELRIL